MQARQERLFSFLLAIFTAIFLMLVLSSCGQEQEAEQTEQEEFDFFQEYFYHCTDWCRLDYDLFIECGNMPEGVSLPRENFVVNCVNRAWEYGCSNYNCEMNSSHAKQRMDRDNIVAYCQGYQEAIFDDERMETGLLTRDGFMLQCP